MFVKSNRIFFKTPVTNKPGQKQEDDTLVTNNNKNIVSHAVKNCHNNFTPQSTGAKSEFNYTSVNFSSVRNPNRIVYKTRVD